MSAANCREQREECYHWVDSSTSWRCEQSQLKMKQEGECHRLLTLNNEMFYLSFGDSTMSDQRRNKDSLDLMLTNLVVEDSVGKN